MNKRNWKIIYSEFSGLEKKAVELINAEVGQILNRDKGVYTLHVLHCEKTPAIIDKNVIIVGKYAENDLIQRFIPRSEIPQNGYLVKVMENPEKSDLKIVIITAETDINVFYGAVDFVDDYLTLAAPISGGLRTPYEIFNRPIPDYTHASAPTAETRSIFTWGHPINNYRKYIDNAARMKINQLIIWNDFLPVNAKDIVDYAHEYKIEIMWGFPWGWKTDCSKIDFDKMDELKNEIIKEFRDTYDGAGDGIYFQSFTELWTDRIGDVLIAEAVTNFVNSVSGALLEIRPDLHIQFGLHATSVKDHLEHISKVDNRVEIVWEDCGEFPYHYLPVVKDEQKFADTLEFTDRIIGLRENGRTGLVYKGMMTMDWSKFVHQSGPYIMGNASLELIKNDVEMLKPIWKSFQGEWMVYGRYAHTLSQRVLHKTGGKINLCIAGALDGGLWFPAALCSEIMWDCTKPYEQILEKVAKRQCITMA